MPHFLHWNEPLFGLNGDPTSPLPLIPKKKEKFRDTKRKEKSLHYLRNKSCGNIRFNVSQKANTSYSQF